MIVAAPDARLRPDQHAARTAFIDGDGPCLRLGIDCYIDPFPRTIAAGATEQTSHRHIARPGIATQPRIDIAMILRHEATL